MNAWAPNPALYLSPEMVAELALGVDPPLAIAQKYGFSPAEFAQLQAQEWFGDAVYRKREELTADGMSFAVKARMIAEEVMQDFFQKTKTVDMRPEHMLEFLKQTAEYGGLKQKAAAGPVGGGGPTFAIQINIPTNPAAPALHGVEAVQAAKPATMVIDLQAQQPLPPGKPVPGFKLTSDLMGAV